MFSIGLGILGLGGTVSTSSTSVVTVYDNFSVTLETEDEFSVTLEEIN